VVKKPFNLGNFIFVTWTRQNAVPGSLCRRKLRCQI